MDDNPINVCVSEHTLSLLKSYNVFKNNILKDFYNEFLIEPDFSLDEFVNSFSRKDVNTGVYKRPRPAVRNIEDKKRCKALIWSHKEKKQCSQICMNNQKFCCKHINSDKRYYGELND